MKFGIPQILIIVLFAIRWGINIAKDGEPKEGSYSIGVSFAALAIEFGLLYCGGFFS